MSAVDFMKRFAGLNDSVNGRSRYEHKQWLEEMGIKPKSKEAQKYSRAIEILTSYEADESDCDPGRTRLQATKSRQTVNFASSTSSPLPDLSIGEVSNLTQRPSSSLSSTVPITPTLTTALQPLQLHATPTRITASLSCSQPHITAFFNVSRKKVFGKSSIEINKIKKRE